MFTEVQPRKQYRWNGQVVETDGFVNPWTVRVRILASGICTDAPTSELTPLAKTATQNGDARVVSADDWEWAKKIRDTVEPYSDQPRLPPGEVVRLADALGKSVRQVQRYRQRHRESDLLTNLAPKPDGRKAGSRGLHPVTERVIAHCIKKYYLMPERPREAAVLERIEKLCRAMACPRPSRTAVSARIKDADAYQTTLKRSGRKKATEKFGAKPGSLTTSRPLEVVQIDHTLVDVRAVSNDQHRDVLMRPWVTFALDVHTRCVLGMYLALHAPSALSVGLCISHAMLPKEPWLKDLGVDASWPMYGRPKIIHTDNATEFRGTPMARGCEQYGVILEHRPVGRPHWGGHIERLIGTLMGRVHLLPGTTFSNIKQKGEYDSDKHACMTLGGLQEWLIHEISGRYHHTVHRGIGMTPAQAWTQGFSNADRPN